MSQRKIQLQGTLTTATGNSLPNTTLSLSEIDTHQVITFTTDSAAGYSVSVPEGTWKVTVQPPQSPPRMTGVLAVTAATQGGALSDLLTALSPSSLDMSVLSFMRGLVDEAERATEALNTGREVIDLNVKKSLDAVDLTQQAVKEAYEIVGGGRPGRDGQSAYEIWASQQPAGTDTTISAWMEYSKGTPGLPGKDGAPGAPGRDGKDGQSAYEIWKSQQSSGTDTSMAAYIEFQRGTPGKDGVPGADGKSAYEVWKEQQSEGDDTSMDAYQESLKGESAYDIWREQKCEDEDTSMDAFMGYMRGAGADFRTSPFPVGTYFLLDTVGYYADTYYALDTVSGSELEWAAHLLSTFTGTWRKMSKGGDPGLFLRIM